MNEHYKKFKYEPRKVIDDWDLSWNLSNVIKYVARCNHKGQKRKDLKKSIEYLEFELEEMNDIRNTGTTNINKD